LADKTINKTVVKKKHSRFIGLVIRMAKEKPLGTLGAVITILLLFVGIFANFLAPHGMNEMIGRSMQPPSSTYLFGTDNLGRDIFSRVIYGARISVIVGLAATSISTVVSTLIGLLTGYIGGAFDLIVQRLVDAVMSLPNILLLMVVMSIIGTGLWQVIVCMGVVFGISGVRMVRGLVINMKENMYINAATAIGGSTWTIILKHILPNIMATVIILFSMGVPGTILTEAGLSFLGFGIPPPNPSWGGMLSGSARTYMFQAPWMALWPGLALSVMVYGVNMFGDAVRDILDPRLIGGIGRYGLKVTKSMAKKGKIAAVKDENIQ
jgi:peptide/nickel transport system permease protein